MDYILEKKREIKKKKELGTYQNFNYDINTTIKKILIWIIQGQQGKLLTITWVCHVCRLKMAK